MKKAIHSKPIKLQNVRLSFPTLKEPTRFDPDNEREIPKYKAAFILDPKVHAETIKEIKATAKQLMDEMWGGKPNGFKDIDCFGDGNNKVNAQGDVYDGYQDMFYVQGNNPKRPLLLHKDKTPVDKDEIEDVFQAGYRVNGSINFWTQDNKFGKAIRCTLRGIQFVREDETFGGGGVNADLEFDDLADDDEGDYGF